MYQRSTGEFRATQATMSFVARGSEGDTLSGLVEVKSQRMFGNLPAQQTVAEGDVRVVAANGLRGWSERASYDGKAGFLRGNVRTRIKTDAYDITSDSGFYFDLKTERYEFFGPVRTVLGVDE